MIWAQVSPAPRNNATISQRVGDLRASVNKGYEKENIIKRRKVALESFRSL
jgi:hypothetical protein